jgi:hypothetical protein
MRRAVTKIDQDRKESRLRKLNSERNVARGGAGSRRGLNVRQLEAVFEVNTPMFWMSHFFSPDKFPPPLPPPQECGPEGGGGVKSFAQFTGGKNVRMCLASRERGGNV